MYRECDREEKRRRTLEREEARLVREEEREREKERAEREFRRPEEAKARLRAKQEKDRCINENLKAVDDLNRNGSIIFTLERLLLPFSSKSGKIPVGKTFPDDQLDAKIDHKVYDKVQKHPATIVSCSIDDS